MDLIKAVLARDAAQRQRLAASSRRRVRRLSCHSKYPPLPTAGDRPARLTHRLKKLIFPVLVGAFVLIVGIAVYFATRAPSPKLPEPAPDVIPFPGMDSHVNR